MALLRLLRLALRVVTWPFRLVRKLRRRPLRVTPFRGYGTSDRIVLRGRVVDTPAIEPRPHAGRLRRLRNLFRRLSTPPVPSARILARAGHAEATTTSGSDGMFAVELEGTGLEANGQWTPVHIEAEAGKHGRAEARGEALVVGPEARFGIISDIDDTVVFTGVANRLAMMWTLFATEAESRVAFEGVGAFYRALHGHGDLGRENPIFYVSRGPWTIYPVLVQFFRDHDIPIGPILLLRDWGIHLAHPWPKRAKEHKRALVDELLALYPDLPFILVGDSGQHDPETYAEAVEHWGDRIACCYIRDVSKDAARAEAIASLARRVEVAGSEMVLARDTATMAQHAADRGFIARGDVGRVERQRNEDQRLFA